MEKVVMVNVLKVKKILNHHQGFSLVEVLLASSIGLIILASVTSAFLPGYKMATKRSLKLMLAQDVNDALKLMKEDILRAGYNEGLGGSFIIDGETTIVYLQPSSPYTCLSYGYYDGSEYYYRSFYFKNKKLNVYTTTLSNKGTSSICKNGASIMDYEKIDVTKFEITENKISSGGVNSQFLTLTLEVSTKDGEVSVANSIRVLTRNWG
ncbi:PilW family protein [Photobacterium ganghwense]|uniref:PilW family protein n=1 Tax=Photobacterium ganghwense TaxID=320778 RepID=UPI004056B1A7